MTKDALICELVAALDAALRQMKDDVMRIEGEWGSGRSFDQLHAAGEIPEAFPMAIVAMVHAVEAGYKP